jgi:protein ImuB
MRLQKLARGEGSRPLVPAAPPLHFEETAELEHPLTLLEPLALLLSHMLEQLCTRLSARALSGQEIRLELELDRESNGRNGQHVRNGQGRPIHLSIPSTSSTLSTKLEYHLRLPVPMLDTKVLLKLLQLELQGRPPGAPVKKVSLAAEPVLPRSTQSGLFLPAAPEPAELEVMLARIKAVISRQSTVGSLSVLASGNWRPATGDCLCVGAVELLDSHKPDAIRMKPFVAVNQPPAKQAPGDCNFANSQQPTATSRPATALRRFRPPLPLRVEVREKKPVRVVFLSLCMAPTTGDCLLWTAGPWHESGEWWTGQPWSREVWDVALKSGDDMSVYRIFRDALRNEWFMEAMYD